MADSKTRRRRGERRRRRARRPLSIGWVIFLDAMLFAASLLTFAYYHHVKPRIEQPVGIVSRREARTIAPETTPGAEATGAPAQDAEIQTAEAETTLVLSNLAAGEVPAGAPEETAGATVETPEPTADATPTVTPAATPEPTSAATPEATPPPTELPEDEVGVFAKRHAGRFTDGEVVADSAGYRNQNVSVRFERHLESESLIYYVADIYVRDIKYLQTAFASETFGRGHAEELIDISARMNSVMAINGDYYGARADGIVIRNGELYRDDKNPRRDVCVLYWDGTMETYSPQEWDTDAAMENGAYQAWNFGPLLLDRDGQALTDFRSDVRGKNPRTAIGYFEPGHYCFVVVDGRSRRSTGMTLAELSELMHNLGCQRAYNLDGGQSSEMVADGTVVNKPFRGGRKTSDAILILPDA